MYQEITRHLEELKELCRRYRVTRLYLFGSAAADAFQQGKSDLDFLVDFEAMTPGDHADTYFSLAEALEALFSVKVDLVEEKTINNPYFREEVEETRVMLYAA
ncbi:MAG: nucleotidyltransferase family protein [Armatimonadota bacterium]